MFANRFSRFSGPDAEQGWRRTALVVIALLAIIQMARVVAKPRGDFHLHWQFGQRLVAGEYPYAENGLDLPYLPFWAVAHAPLTLLPLHLAQILLLPMFAVAAYGLFRVLSRLSQRIWPMEDRLAQWAAILTILLASRFLIRDILECGVNLALVALAWGAFFLWQKRRDWAGGSLLGFAIALKLTPALFLAWFAWKRQWKLVSATAITVGVLFLTPLLFLDWHTFDRTHRVWWFHASRGLLVENPVHGVLGEESIQNLSLRPALGRYLMSLPEGHNARFDHPWAVEFLDLSPAAAGWVVKILIGSLVLAVASRFRKRVGSRREPTLLWEASAVSVLILLLSPLTWGQHCVGVIPAVYLLVREAFYRKTATRETWAVLGFYSAFILVLNRGLVGKEATYLLDSYFITTWCLLAVLWLTLRSHGRELAACENPVIRPIADSQTVQRAA